VAIIDKPSDYFNTKLYTGTGSSNAVTGVGFQPDWIWLKGRSVASDHKVFDAVRGGPNNLIQPNLTNAQQTTSYFSSINSDGFTVTGSDNSYNASNATYASWNWKANGSGSTNTDGSINSTVSASATSGFSIVKVSKPNTSVATIGHGLGVTPKFIIGKDLDGADNWTCYNEALGNGKGIYLNATNAQATASTFWNSTSPTSSVFTIGSDNTWNSPSIVFYCFADVQGYSKFGSYTGNGSTDGAFVYTGFKPAFTLIKRTDATEGGSWILFDNKRGTNVINPVDVVMAASNNASEADWGTAYDCDYLSNGFKWRYAGANGYNNTNGATYIYMAFAENPFVTSTAIPTTAR
jgi:hypothetical protein